MVKILCVVFSTQKLLFPKKSQSLSAALQFTVHLAQSSLEASIRRHPGVSALPPKELSIEYADVARAVQGDPRLEPLHDNVPHQIQAQEALVKRAELMAKESGFIFTRYFLICSFTVALVTLSGQNFRSKTDKLVDFHKNVRIGLIARN